MVSHEVTGPGLQSAFSTSQKGGGGLLARPHLPLDIQPTALAL